MEIVLGGDRRVRVCGPVDRAAVAEVVTALESVLTGRGVMLKLPDLRDLDRGLAGRVFLCTVPPPRRCVNTLTRSLPQTDHRDSSPDNSHTVIFHFPPIHREKNIESLARKPKLCFS
jgi:hypothetical protein